MSRKKQVIFIMTDTQRTDMLGCYGNERMITPNLDRLAREGIRYDKAYTTQPVCQPAQSGNFYGKLPTFLRGVVKLYGIVGQCAEYRTEAERRGNHTALCGKWHWTGEIIRAGQMRQRLG